MTDKSTYSYEQKIAFIKSLYCPARQCADETGCSWELILAQAATETGWGEKILHGTNNIFNIKASPDWHGESKVFNVWEKVHGEKVWVNAPFAYIHLSWKACAIGKSFLRRIRVTLKAASTTTM